MAALPVQTGGLGSADRLSTLDAIVSFYNLPLQDFEGRFYVRRAWMGLSASNGKGDMWLQVAHGVYSAI